MKRAQQGSIGRARANRVHEKRLRKIALVGSPNVGKSVLFGSLTGTYVTVSNYPGTTIEIARGRGKIDGNAFEVIDTPGMYTLIPLTEDERVARTILFEEKPDIILQVVDAKNLQRMLPLTLQLIEAELPLILVINMLDEADKVGMKINIENLEEDIGIPVVATIATDGWGVDALKKKIKDYHHRRAIGSVRISYDKAIETTLNEIILLLAADYPVSKRAVGLLLLQGDTEIINLIRRMDKDNYNSIEKLVKTSQTDYAYPWSYFITMQRHDEATWIVAKALTPSSEVKMTAGEYLSRLTMNPWTGVPILLAVLYFGFYQFVGVFGAGFIVGLLEEEVFGRFINPAFTDWIMSSIPYLIIQDLLVGQYGVLTLGLRYAVALILPIVGTFFIIFSLIEDVGYLPRLAMLIDKVFKKIGLTGKAVIPIFLGFGCNTMATIVTRTQETGRERIIATLLLALAIPCSAQLGVILAILSNNPAALAIWAIVIFTVFIFIGYLTSKLIPGSKPSFIIEIPPLRVPKLKNILVKTLARMEWYFMEVFPYFILASVLLWIGQITGAFPWVIGALEPLVRAIGLPNEAAVVFLFGFFRRDYGAAGLYDLQQSGLLSSLQLTVTAVTLTLFVPCIAQFLVMVKERGVKMAVMTAIFIFPFAFAIGYVLNIILSTLGVMI